jgi:hypothetical protein
MSRVERRATIGQEGDLHVTLVSDAAPHQAEDGDLILLDDAEIGHEDIAEIRWTSARTAG